MDTMEETEKEVSVRVCESVSEAMQEPMEALPPLSDAINLDGLDAIVTGDLTHDVTVTFSYAGMRVLVHSGSTIYVRPIREGTENQWETSV